MSQINFLPTPIADFLKAIHDKDADSFGRSFDLNALLEDEGIKYNGRTTIQAWGANALIARSASISVQKVTIAGTRVILRVVIDGDYKGSHGITEPFTIYMDFTISRAYIEALTITLVDSEGPSMFAVWAKQGNRGIHFYL
jgi:hypothetical protein